MRKVAFVSLDDVMQAPGGPQEDPTLRARRRSTRHPASFDAVKKQVADLFNGITKAPEMLFQAPACSVPDEGDTHNIGACEPRAL